MTARWGPLGTVIALWGPKPYSRTMIVDRTPKLTLLPDGRFMVKWGRKKHYLGRDPVEARKLYAESITEWATWRESVARAQQNTPGKKLLVTDLVDLFLNAKGLEGGPDLAAYYRKHLRRFNGAFGGHLAADIRVGDLQSLKDTMLRAGYKPKTINHDVIGVKAMFTWGSDLEHIPPVNLRGCRALPLGPPRDRSMTVEEVRDMIDRATDVLKPWLRVGYLALLRPTETIRLVHRQGDWTEPGIFRLDHGKNDLRSKQPRHLVLSDLALEYLEDCKPVWSRLDSYSQAVRAACGRGGPHPLRHSGATHLIRLGVNRADVDLLLGHLPSRVSLTYAPIAWQPLRKKVGRLSL